MHKYVHKPLVLRSQSETKSRNLKRGVTENYGKKVIGSKNVLNKSCRKLYILGGEFLLF